MQSQVVLGSGPGTSAGLPEDQEEDFSEVGLASESGWFLDSPLGSGLETRRVLHPCGWSSARRRPSAEFCMWGDSCFINGSAQSQSIFATALDSGTLSLPPLHPQLSSHSSLSLSVEISPQIDCLQSMIKELRVAVKGWVRDVAQNPANQRIQILDLRLCGCTGGPQEAGFAPPPLSPLTSLPPTFLPLTRPKNTTTGCTENPDGASGRPAPSGSGHLLVGPSEAPPSLLPQPVPVVEPVQGGFGLFCLIRSRILRTARGLGAPLPIEDHLASMLKGWRVFPGRSSGSTRPRLPGSARVVAVRLTLRVRGAGNLQHDLPWDPQVLCHEPCGQHSRQHACQATWASHLVST